METKTPSATLEFFRIRLGFHSCFTVNPIGRSGGLASIDPWCVVGDFNKIVVQDKKLGERLRPQKQMDDFRMTLTNNGLVDLG